MVAAGRCHVVTARSHYPEKEPTIEATWLSVGGGATFFCALITAIVLQQALSSTTRGLAALTAHLAQLDRTIAALREDIEQWSRGGVTLPPHSDPSQCHHLVGGADQCVRRDTWDVSAPRFFALHRPFLYDRSTAVLLWCRTACLRSKSHASSQKVRDASWTGHCVPETVAHLTGAQTVRLTDNLSSLA